MKTSIVVLTHNQFHLTRQCIESIRKHTPEAHELIIVDNGSTDETVPYLEAQTDIKLIKNSNNRGFAAGCNQGIAAASGDSVLFLNNDTIVTHNWLRNLQRALYRSEEVGMVGSVSNSVHGPQQVPVTYRDVSELDDFAASYCEANAGRTMAIRRLIAFCLLVRKSVLDEIGLFDERFGLGNFEDDDLCLRALRSGYLLRVALDSFVHHFQGGTFSQLKDVYYWDLYYENKQKAKQKWGEEIDVLMSRPRVAVSLCVVTENAKSTLRRCLDSVRDLVDEIIVLDLGSTDGTIDLAQQYTNQVVEFRGGEGSSSPWELANEHATMDYIFWLDGTERLSVTDRKKFRALKESMDSSVQAVTMTITNKDRSIEEKQSRRLVKRGSVAEPGSQVGHIPLDDKQVFHSDISLTKLTAGTTASSIAVLSGGAGSPGITTSSGMSTPPGVADSPGITASSDMSTSPSVVGSPGVAGSPQTAGSSKSTLSPKIAVYGFYKNDEPRIGDFLDSVKSADEIVLCDTGSSDNSNAIVREFQVDNPNVNIKVVPICVSPWRFDDARNVALSLVGADTDLCVALDIGERLMDGWKEYLVQKWDPLVTRYDHKVKIFHSDEDTFEPKNGSGPESVSVQWQARIHVRAGYKWKLPVHEMLEYKGEENVQLLPDFWFYKCPATEQTGNYLPLLERAVSEGKRIWTTWRYLAGEYVRLRRYEDALRVIDTALETADSDKGTLYKMKFRVYQQMGKSQLALTNINQAILHTPNDRELYLLKAEYLYTLRRHLEALLTLKEAEKITDEGLDSAFGLETWGKSQTMNTSREVHSPETWAGLFEDLLTRVSSALEEEVL